MKAASLSLRKDDFSVLIISSAVLGKDNYEYMWIWTSEIFCWIDTVLILPGNHEKQQFTLEQAVIIFSFFFFPYEKGWYIETVLALPFFW